MSLQHLDRSRNRRISSKECRRNSGHAIKIRNSLFVIRYSLSCIIHRTLVKQHEHNLSQPFTSSLVACPYLPMKSSISSLMSKVSPTAKPSQRPGIRNATLVPNKRLRPFDKISSSNPVATLSLTLTIRQSRWSQPKSAKTLVSWRSCPRRTSLSSCRHRSLFLDGLGTLCSTHIGHFQWPFF